MTKNDAYTDWVEALAEMDNAKMNCDNPFFKSKYADLPAVIEATKPVLAAHGLAITQPTGYEGEIFGVFTKVVHTSGEVVERSFYPLSMSGKPQDRGSELTYARRYEWASVCGIAADQDDDGNGANKVHDDRKGAAKRGGAQNPNWTGPLTKKQLWEKHEEISDAIKETTNIDDCKAVTQSDEFKAYTAQAEQDWPDLLSGYQNGEQWEEGTRQTYKKHMADLMQLEGAHG